MNTHLPLFVLLGVLGTVLGLFFRNKPKVAIVLFMIPLIPLLFSSYGAAFIVTTLLLGILLAQPLFAVLGFVTVICFEFLSDVPPLDYGIFPEKIFELTDKNVLLAIPFFVIAGAIMTQGGIAKRLVDVAKALTTWIPGGLAIASIGGCILFAAISGSSPVTVIAIGGMMYPALKKDGFGEQASIGLLSSAGSLGIVIPPSIPMIIFAIVVSGQQVIDVGDLFLAGIGPGFLIGGMLASYVVWLTLKKADNRKELLTTLGKGLAVIVAAILLGELSVLAIGPIGHALGPVMLCVLGGYIARKAVLEGFWALLLPLLILGGIYAGIFTPTEAAAVAVVYSLVVAIYIHRELKWSDLPALVTESTITMGALITIMVIAFVFNDYLVEEEIPGRAVEWIQSQQLSRTSFLLALNIFLLIVGCFMDIISAILIIAPLVVPMAMAPGIEIDPIHLGLIFIVNLEIGYLTPPLGLNLFVASTLFKKPLGEVVRATLPYSGLMLIGVLLITYIPAITLGPGQWIESLSQPSASNTAINISTDSRTHAETEQNKNQEGQSKQTKVLSIEQLMNMGGGGDDEDLDEKELDEDNEGAEQ